ncbi:MAG: Uma2 family endonuclease [Planctomycetes bacterium]|nr:Uma2 family endonuclease [Planctomycetota bacterium]
MTMTEASPVKDPDQRVRLHGVTWEQYERILEIRGESSAVRISYLDGELELMSPSIDHERIKKFIARLLEAWCEECGPDLNGYGSWTVKEKAKRCGLEPDECYIVGIERKERPDIAIEVIWTHGGLGKLEIYQKLGVPEVWNWEDGSITVFVLEGETYERKARSELLPHCDLDAICRFADRENQTQAVRDFRAELRRKGHGE